LQIGCNQTSADFLFPSRPDNYRELSGHQGRENQNAAAIVSRGNGCMWKEIIATRKISFAESLISNGSAGYWYSILPFNYFIFGNMIRNIASC
jgi:hypothetical protein